LLAIIATTPRTSKVMLVGKLGTIAESTFMVNRAARPRTAA